jgi:hypothetical protein
MALSKTIVLRSDSQAQQLYALLKANWRAMAETGKPLAVRVYEYRESRRDKQNSFYWLRLGQIAEQAWSGGRQYDAKCWHELMKEMFLPEETAAGMPKWKLLPNDKRVMFMSSTDLNVGEFAEYMTKVEAYVASDLGIELT